MYRRLNGVEDKRRLWLSRGDQLEGAGPMEDNLTALMSTFDIRCVPVHQRCAPSETHAAGAIRSIADRHADQVA